MAFSTIQTDKPTGTQYVSDVDDAIRETRTWVVDCLSKITGYPNLETAKITSWTSEALPSGAVAGMIGYNSSTGRIEYLAGSGTSVTRIDPIASIYNSISSLSNDKVPWSAVNQYGGKIPTFTTDGHIVFPNGAHLWVG